MRSPLRARLWRFLAAAGLSAALLLPAAATSAQTSVILRVGTTQDLDSLNPYATILVVGYEAFGLSYNYMVDSGLNLEPVPGFAESWERNADGHGWTFHIREGMKWSDGQPVTAPIEVTGAQSLVLSLESMDVEIDHLTAEQAKYLASWDEGT